MTLNPKGSSRGWLTTVANGARSWSIAARMGMAFGLVLLLFAGTTAFAVYQMHAMERDMDSALHASTEVSGRAMQMRQNINQIYLNSLLLVLATNHEDMKFYADEIGARRAAYVQAKKDLFALTHAGRDLPKLADAMKVVDESEAVLEEVEQTMNRRKSAAASVAVDDALEVDDSIVAHLSANVKNQIDFWVKSVDAIVALTAAAGRERQAAAAATASLARTVQIAAAAVGLIIGALAAWLISRNVTVPIRRAVSVAERVAEGDLSEPIERGAKDETGALLDALSHMQDSLHRVVGEVLDSVNSIETASAEVASGNGDLSQRTEQAASQLQRTTGSVAQLSEAVHHSAESARTADALARGAAQAAERGGAVVEQVVSSMQLIATQSSKIADIIGVIDGIAFQTNILALNAAVEAARAGEQGRGFAVVAGEVRTLAQRSAAAAKDIKSLIGASVEGVESGSRLVQEAGQTMQTIVASVRKVTAAIEEISGATESQSVGINEVGGAMNEIDRMTQQNAALVEQSTAAAESLKAQAQRLAQVVAMFQLSAQGQRHGVRALDPAM